MLQQPPTITSICSTIGRPCLKGMVESFWAQELLPEDRLIVLGDGWADGEWINEHPNSEFHARPFVGMYGHKHRVEAMMEMVNTTHYTFIDDDDRYMPWGFKDVRPLLTSIPILTAIILPSGLKANCLDGTQNNRPCIGGWQMWMPRTTKLCDFSNISDAQAWRNYVNGGGEFEEHFEVAPVHYKGYAWDSN